jgi:hypothetical protein
MKPLQSPLFLLISLAFLFGACTKENTKDNYQQHIHSATEAVLAHQTLAQVTLTYLKGIHDSLLLANNFVEKDGASYYLTQQGEEYELEIRYPLSKLDEYERWRDGTIKVYISGGLHADGSLARFSFHDFFLDQNPFFENEKQNVSAGDYTLQQMSGQNSSFVYDQKVESFGFYPDTLGNKIHISDLSTYEWVRSAGSSYFNADDKVTIVGSSEIITKSGHLVKSDVVDALVFSPNSCIYYKEGSFNLKFEKIEPGGCQIIFRASETCAHYADLELDDLHFLVSLVYPYGTAE